MLHNDYARKGSAEKKNISGRERRGLGAKMNTFTVNRHS
jgi:hypothetical protein